LELFRNVAQIVFSHILYHAKTYFFLKKKKRKKEEILN
jgi:hypothetical protein